MKKEEIDFTIHIEQQVDLEGVRSYALCWFPEKLSFLWRNIIARVPDALQKAYYGQGNFMLLFDLPVDFLLPIRGEKREKGNWRLWDLNNPDALRSFSDVWEGTSEFGSILMIFLSPSEEPQRGRAVSRILECIGKKSMWNLLREGRTTTGWVEKCARLVSDTEEPCMLLLKIWDGQMVIAAFGSGSINAERPFFDLLGV